MDNDTSTEDGVPAAIVILKEAWRSGRPIVPFLGAGLSSGSGFPLVENVRSYLLKVRFYLRYGGYREALHLKDNPNPRVDDPENKPSRYLTDFGWPNLNQLNSDLYHIARPVKGGDFKKALASIENIATKLKVGDSTFNDVKFANVIDALKQPRSETSWIDQVAVRTYYSAQQSLASSTCLQKSIDLLHDYLAAIDSPQHLRWGRGRWRLETAAQFAQLEDLRVLYDADLARIIQESVWQHRLSPRPDWSRQLMQLAEGNLSLIDALIGGWGLRYSPTTSHVMLAHLVRRLNIRLLLSLNFDPYIEQTMRDEGVDIRVIEVTRDEDPPDTNVIRQSRTLIKLHGGGHSLRLGERLDYALDDDTRNRVAQCVGDEALLLVVGFSGYERRMMQLIEHLTLSCPFQRSSEKQLRVLWMHFEPESRIPATVIDLENKLKSVGRECLFMRKRLPGAEEFLFEAYQHLVGSYPKTVTQIPSLPKRVLALQLPSPKPPEQPPQTPDDDPPIRLYTGRRLWDDKDHAEDLADNPSIKMSRFVQNKQKSYHLVWIDLEDHHTVAGVVTEIIERMRIFDPDLPPLVLPVDPFHRGSSTSPGQSSTVDEGLNKAVRFLHRALRRGKYILAFDSLESFGREQTSHHGLPSFTAEDENACEKSDAKKREKRASRIEKNVEHLINFLDLLLGKAHNCPEPLKEVRNLDWYCAISCEIPTSRHEYGENNQNLLTKAIREKLTSFLTISGEFLPFVAPTPSCSNIKERLERTEASSSGVPHQKTVVPSDGQRTPDERLTNAIHGMLNELSPKVPNSSAWLEKPDLIPFYMLSVARRPRSLILIEKLLNEFVPPQPEINRTVRKKRIENVIDNLKSSNLLLAMQGGFHWIPHHEHERAYKLLTSDIAQTKIDELLPTDPPLPLKEAIPKWHRVIERLVFVCLCHSRLSRFYYLHVFQRTRDPNALYEYLYHRISTLRYLKILDHLLQGIFTRVSKENAAVYVDFSTIFPALHVLFKFDPIHEFTLPDSTNSIEIFRERLAKLRAKLMQAMLNVFNRENDVIFSHGSPDTWIAWMIQLENDFNHVAKSKESNLEQEEDCQILLGRLLLRLRNIKARLFRDKRQWGACLQYRGEMLFSLLLQPNSDQDNRSGNEPAQPLFTQITLKLKGVLEHAFKNDEGKRQDLETATKLHNLAEELWQNFQAAKSEGTLRPNENEWKVIIKKVASCMQQITTELPNLTSDGKDALAQSINILIDQSEPRDSNILIDQIESFFESLLDVARCLTHLLPDSKTEVAPGVTLPPPDSDNSAEFFIAFGLELIKIVQEDFLSLRNPPSSFSKQQEKEKCSEPQEKRRAPRNFHREIRKRITSITKLYRFEEQRLKVAKLDVWADSPALSQKNEEKYRQVYAQLFEELNKTRGTDCLDLHEFFLRRCQIRSLQGQCLLWLGQHRDALDVLNNGQTGLGDATAENRSVLALIWEIRAHTLMRMGDTFIRTGFEDRITSTSLKTSSQPPSQTHDDQFTPRDRIEEDSVQLKKRWRNGRARLDEARDALIEAEKLLRRGRRLTGQWIRLYAAKMQIEIEELLLLLTSLQSQPATFNSDRMHFLAEIHNILHRGLEAFRGGWDCVPLPTPTENSLVTRERRPWLVRWVQLMLGAYSLCQIYPESAKSYRSNLNTTFPDPNSSNIQHSVIKNYHESREDNSFAIPENFAKLWIALNTSVGNERRLMADRNSKETQPEKLEILPWFKLLQKARQFFENGNPGVEHFRELALMLMSQTVKKVTPKTEEEKREPDLSQIFEELVQGHCQEPRSTEESFKDLTRLDSF